MSTPTPSMANMASKLATSKPANTTATPVSSGALNKSVAPKPTPTPAGADKGKVESQMKQAADSTPNTPTETAPTPTQEVCANIIEESDDVITALESIGELFGIPKENIICDDTLDTIKVQGDKIMAPCVPTDGCGNAIMRSISAVLDYISQRIDAKLNGIQSNNVANGVIIDHIKNDSDPSKGKVIARHMTDDGDEVLVYDSGLVDMPNTDAARSLVTQLRAGGRIPTPAPVTKPTGLQYFTDEDNITNGVDMSTPTQGGSNVGDSAAGPKLDNPNDDVGTTTATPPTTDDTGSGIPSQEPVGSEIDMGELTGESYTMLDLVSKYNNTKYLGYEMMTEMGVPNIQPVDFLLEAGEDGGKKILPSDIKHMKFDNTHILKAVKLFNEIRAEQKDVKGKDIDIGKMVASPKWHQAIKELEQQFDCHLVIHYLKDDNNPHDTDAMTQTTQTGHEYRQNVTVSKSKGFRLNGLPITVYLLNNVLIEHAPTDPTLFGQAVTSLLLHEIFHNVMMQFREYNVEFDAMLTTTMITASLVESPKVRRKLITNFANAVDAMAGPNGKMSAIEKRAYVKKLLLLCSLRESQENKKLAQSLVEDDTTNVDKYIELAEKYQQKVRNKSSVGRFTIKTLVTGAVGISLLSAGVTASVFWPFAVGSVLAGGAYIGFRVGLPFKKKQADAIKARERGDVKDYEEHWADTFASMYNLPVSLFSVPNSHAVAAKMTDDQIKRIHQIEMNWVTLMGSDHPPTTERLAASVKYAKQTLESGIKLNPDVKRYLEWIIANHGRILEVEDIDNVFSKATFDPKTAEDIDLHIANLISHTNAEITEQST